ncbi:MAG: glycosyltransferase family 2 protein [bacterium]|nr:glycosyltransferase family 2 protein [bacterium]
MIVFDIIFAVPVAFFVVIATYLAIVTLAALFFRKRTGDNTDAMTVAVLVPAHNEELQIEASVGSLLRVDYPRDRFQVFVIADNCTDLTADRAREAGAEVFERHDPENPGKGQALDWCLRTHRDTLAPFEAIALIDADATANAAFLPELAASLSAPDAVVAQSFNGVSNPDHNWRTALTYAGFALINHVRACGRCMLGASSGLKGNGMAFRSDVLLHYGWPAHSVVEDIEFSVRLLIDGHRVGYNPDARLLSEMPAGRSEADTQRRRWEGGRFDLYRTHLPVLLKAALTKWRWRFFDAVLDILVPPLSLLVMGQVVLAALAFVHPVWLPVMGYCLAATAFHVLGGLALSRAPGRVWLYLFTVPFFLLWKVPIYVGMLVRKRDTIWQRTTRQAELDQAAENPAGESGKTDA